MRDSVRAGGGLICAYAGDARAAVDRAVRTEPDLCLVVAGLPGGAAEAAADIAARVPSTGVIVLA